MVYNLQQSNLYLYSVAQVSKNYVTVEFIC